MRAVAAADNTAVRVALWRALHVQADPPPHVFEDEIGLALAAPEDGWRERPDMSPFTRPFRASIVARARFIEDLVEAAAARGVDQYVILGAGLDTFAQRRTEFASRMVVFEIDQPGTQAWKRQRLVDLGLGVAPFLRLVPVDFEADDWSTRLAAGARASGTPFLSFFTPAELLALARACGLPDVQHVPAAELGARYFAGRTDGLRPPENTEELIVATT
jgi:methyltransferase (TIGR00027 family)